MKAAAHAGISLPREHGGYVTLAGVSIVAAVAAQDALAAAGAVVVLGAAFFARAQVERRAAGLPLRSGDPAALAALTVLAGAGAWLAGRMVPWFALAAVGTAGAILAGALWARRHRLHRSAAFELLGMTGLGASSALAALAGGAPARTAAVVGLVLGVHAGLSVPLVRGALRRGKRPARARGPILLAVLAATVAALILLGSAPAALALTPRVVQVARLPEGPVTAGQAAVMETAALAVVVLVLVIAS